MHCTVLKFIQLKLLLPLVILKIYVCLLRSSPLVGAMCWLSFDLCDRGIDRNLAIYRLSGRWRGCLAHCQSLRYSRGGCEAEAPCSFCRAPGFYLCYKCYCYWYSIWFYYDLLKQQTPLMYSFAYSYFWKRTKYVGIYNIFICGNNILVVNLKWFYYCMCAYMK